MTFDTTAYYGQPTTMLPPFPPRGLFGGLPALWSALAEQALAAHLGLSPIAGRPRFSPFDIGPLTPMPPAPFAGLPWAGGLHAPFGQPWAGGLQAPFGQMTG